VSSIYSEGGQVRRIHNIVFAPSFEAARKINRRLSEVGNLRADGRPILGLPAHELLKIVLDVSEDCLLVPAHAWTPWFSVFGSKSGFDSIEECFGDLAKYIYAIETGLSSDPSMNWRLSALDNITLISNSDCHSARRIGREANIFSGKELNYKNIIDAIKYSRRKRSIVTEVSLRGAIKASDVAISKTRKIATLPSVARNDGYLNLVETVEFYPEEGKYHYDGHRDCKVSLSPKESHKINQLCPKCGRPMTIGVLSRVEELADRPPFDKSTGGKPEGAVPFRSLVPLDEIIGEALGIGPQTKGVAKYYNNLVELFGNEFKILLDTPISEIEKASLPEIAEALRRVRDGELFIEPGYDGEYGKVKIFNDGERRSKKEQGALF
jgi:PHP family Zn ribbon phosphoesterase